MQSFCLKEENIIKDTKKILDQKRTKLHCN